MTALLPLLEPLEDPLEQLLTQIHLTTGLTWAWSIIALTALVRTVILPITVKQTRSMLAMQKLQPYVKQLQQKYKDDRQALNQAMMEFYRSNRVNPLASCLPLLLQIPIFTALFFVLRDFQPPQNTSQNLGFLWGFVNDITRDLNDVGIQGWILLVFYVGSQMFSTMVMSTSPDPRQKWLFMLLPVFFVPFVINFPVGVMLYWITTNLWTFGQHMVVVRLTNTDREIVLPPDAKGRQKTITPKGQRPSTSKGSQGSSGPRGATRGDDAPAGSASARARRNKRRR